MNGKDHCSRREPLFVSAEQTSFITLQTICSKKNNRRELNNKNIQRHKHKHTQVVFLNIYTFSLIDKKSIEKNIKCKNHLTDEFLL